MKPTFGLHLRLCEVVWSKLDLHFCCTLGLCGPVRVAPRCHGRHFLSSPTKSMKRLDSMFAALSIACIGAGVLAIFVLTTKLAIFSGGVLVALGTWALARSRRPLAPDLAPYFDASSLGFNESLAGPDGMAQLSWRRSYECGHPVIDAQRRVKVVIGSFMQPAAKYRCSPNAMQSRPALRVTEPTGIQLRRLRDHLAGLFSLGRACGPVTGSQEMVVTACRGTGDAFWMPLKRLTSRQRASRPLTRDRAECRGPNVQEVTDRRVTSSRVRRYVCLVSQSRRGPGDTSQRRELFLTR